MENELNLDLDVIEDQAERNLKVKNRFTELVDKVKVESQEKEQALAKATVESEARSNAEKERDFYKGFSQISAKYPEATNYQDQILERVNRGYDQEEAAVAVLAKEGKLGNAGFTPQVSVIQPPANVAGGSASTVLEGGKSNADLSIQERRQKLMELDSKGELWPILKSTNTES